MISVLRDLDRVGTHFDTEKTAASAHARAFAGQLEHAIATLDTSKYEALEVIQFAAIEWRSLSVGGHMMIRRVESGAPSAEELAELGYFDKPVTRVARYDADDLERLRTYVEQGDADDVARLVDEHFDVGDRDPRDVAETLIESLEKHDAIGGER